MSRLNGPHVLEASTTTTASEIPLMARFEAEDCSGGGRAPWTKLADEPGGSANQGEPLTLGGVDPIGTAPKP